MFTCFSCFLYLKVTVLKLHARMVSDPGRAQEEWMLGMKGKIKFRDNGEMARFSNSALVSTYGRRKDWESRKKRTTDLLRNRPFQTRLVAFVPTHIFLIVTK